MPHEPGRWLRVASEPRELVVANPDQRRHAVAEVRQHVADDEIRSFPAAPATGVVSASATAAANIGFARAPLRPATAVPDSRAAIIEQNRIRGPAAGRLRFPVAAGDYVSGNAFGCTMLLPHAVDRSR